MTIPQTIFNNKCLSLEKLLETFQCKLFLKVSQSGKALKEFYFTCIQLSKNEKISEVF
eukprot:UN25948